MISDDLRGQLATLQRHQHAAAGKRIDEGCRIANGQQTFRGRDLMPAKTLKRHGEPSRTRPGVCQGVSCAGVLTDKFAHHALGISGASAHVTRRRDEAKIATAIFDAAEAAIAAPIKIDFARAGCDARVFKMRFERHQRSTVRFRPVRPHATSKCASTSRGVNRDRGAITDLVAGALQSDTANVFLFKNQIHNLRIFQNGDACLAGATQQTLVHLGAAKSER